MPVNFAYTDIIIVYFLPSLLTIFVTHLQRVYFCTQKYIRIFFLKTFELPISIRIIRLRSSFSRLKPHVVPRKSYRLNLLGCILYDCKQNVCRTLWLFEWRTRHSKVRRQEAALIATDAFLSLSQMKGWPPCGAMSTKLLSTRRLPVNDSRYLTKFHVPLNKSYFCLFCEWCLVFYKFYTKLICVF